MAMCRENDIGARAGLMSALIIIAWPGLQNAVESALNAWFTNIVHLPLSTVLCGEQSDGRIENALLISGAVVAALVALAAGTAQAGSGIQVVMNQAKIVKLSRAADTIIVGNPAIADASVQDATTIVLTGKGFGVTNLVVLDSDGNPVVDEQITVGRQEASSVRIYRRAEVQTLSCTPFCESSFKNEAEKISESDTSSSQ